MHGSFGEQRLICQRVLIHSQRPTATIAQRSARQVARCMALPKPDAPTARLLDAMEGQTEQIKELHTVLERVIEWSSEASDDALLIKDVVCLSSCCRAAHDCMRGLLCQPMHWVLQAISCRRIDAVAWVARRLQQLAWQPTPEQLAQLARTPITQQEHVRELVAGSFQPTYLQLVAAAEEAVRGVRWWAPAFSAAGLPPPDGMPAAVDVLCCNETLQLPLDLEGHPTLARDMCLFALDCEHLPVQQLEPLAMQLGPDQLQQVLLAAIKRWNASALLVLAIAPATRDMRSQQLADLAWQLFLCMPTARWTLTFSELGDRVFYEEGALQAADLSALVARTTQYLQQQEEEEGQLQVRHRAARRQLLWRLLRHPAAEHLAAEQLASAMVAGKPPGDDNSLCGLPDAAMQTAGQMLPLLRSAVQLGWSKQVAYLCRQPGVQHMAASEVLELMHGLEPTLIG